jgi:hypothetical protein
MCNATSCRALLRLLANSASPFIKGALATALERPLWEYDFL